MDGISHVPRTVDEIFSDFRGRRAGLIKALTIEVGKFYQQCDPEKVNFCLYGLPNETWEVSLPVEMVPPDLPEPTLGINFARDGMQEEDWLSLVALHSDSWLHSVAIYFGAGVGLCKSERTRLFQMINDLPTVFEVVTGTLRQSKDQSAAHNNSSKSTSGGNMHSRQSESQTKGLKLFPLYKKEDASVEEESKAEQGAGACDVFLICCETCKRWFLAQLITPAQAEHFKQYKSLGFTSKEAMWNFWKYLPLIFIALAILIFVFECGRSI